MFEPLISLAIILVSMTFVLILIGFSWEKSSLFRSFFVIVALWFLYLNLSVGIHGLDVVENINVTKNVYNSTGILVQQENSTSVNDPNQTSAVNNLLGSANFYWLVLVLLITVLEVFSFVFDLINYFGKNKNGSGMFKPL